MSVISGHLTPSGWLATFRHPFERGQAGENSSRILAPIRELIDAPIPIDANGSPVTIEPSYWYVCFVPGLNRQWWHPFVHPLHKHVFVIRPDGDEQWLLIESWWNRILATNLTSRQAELFLRWAARGSILLVRERIPGRSSQLRGWMNCAALVAHHLGRRYWVWTPHQLYRVLRREKDTREVNIPQLAATLGTRGNLNVALRYLFAGCTSSISDSALGRDNVGLDCAVSVARDLSALGPTRRKLDDACENASGAPTSAALSIGIHRRDADMRNPLRTTSGRSFINEWKPVSGKNAAPVFRFGPSRGSACEERP